MKIIYVDRYGKRMQMESEDFEVRIPLLFRYYKSLDSFSLFIDPSADVRKQMRKNLKNKPEAFKYAHGVLICPSKKYSDPDAWEVEGIENMDEDMRERLVHYWEGYTCNFFNTYCSENTRLWRGTDTTLGTKFYLNDTIISEACDCTFILSGNDNGVRFSELSNVLLFIMGDYYEVE